ncbi:hypothetical protein [Haloglomus salinum]|jgi:hypothetical protein|uniref:hypothetical protein n=1 Tax=Haloglomus salinum TaxID=2962673 RepID=UPI0020CA1164|nr:hypothetical protein [Haloglomus salinum]
MSGWSPPSIPRPWLVAALGLYALVVAYSVLIAGQLLLGVVPGLFLVGLYLLWRLLVAVEAIAEAQQRLADHRTERGEQLEAPDEAERRQ